jgi:hypothetical protein
MRKISLYLTCKQITSLRNLAKGTQRTQASHIRQAIDEYVKFEHDPESCGIESQRRIK